MRARTLLAAIVLAVFMTGSLWSARTGGHLAHLPDLISSTALVLTFVLLGWLLSSRFTADPDRRGLVALTAGIWVVAFGTFHILTAIYLLPGLARPWLARPWLAALTWTALCAVFAALITRGRRPITFAARALFIAAFVLVAGQGFTAASRVLAREAPAPSQPIGAARTSPDVYVIVLDKYSSGSWLRRAYDLDQEPFEDSLRQLGFVVPALARANYAHTEIALATLLNWSYFGTGSDDSTRLGWNDMRQLVIDAKAWEVFRAKGYRTVALPTTFSATRRFPNVDQELRTPMRLSSALPLTWWSNSPMAFLATLRCGDRPCLPATAETVTPYPIEDLAAIRWKLRTLASLPDSSGPIFAFAHLLVPHEPYLFNADCSERKPWWPLTDQGEEFDDIGNAYADQVRCFAPLLLQTVRELIERSTVPPVIILQSDHGHGRIAVDPLRGFTLTAEQLSAERMAERLAVFAAYRFPGADSLVSEDITPVNVLPLVMRSIFGEGPPLQPDRSYWSSYQSAFTFTELPLEAFEFRENALVR